VKHRAMGLNRRPSRVDLLVELVDNLSRRGPGRTDHALYVGIPKLQAPPAPRAGLFPSALVRGFFLSDYQVLAFASMTSARIGDHVRELFRASPGA